MTTGWIDKLKQYPIDWSFWAGRRTTRRSAWVSDGKMGVLRSACDPKRLKRIEGAEDTEPWRPANRSGADVRRIIERLPSVRHPAESLGEWESEEGGWPGVYIALGDPDLASFFVGRLRILHLLCAFDKAFWYEGRNDGTGHLHPLVVERRGAIVGILMPVNIGGWFAHVPQDVRDAYQRTLRAPAA